MSDDNVIPMVDLDLDTVERPEADLIRPFKVNIGGKPITFSNPSDLDWQDLLEIQEPAGLIRHCVSEEDRVHLAGVRIPGWKFGKLMEAFLKHYQLEEKLAQAKRNGQLGV